MISAVFISLLSVDGVITVPKWKNILRTNHGPLLQQLTYVLFKLYIMMSYCHIDINMKLLHMYDRSGDMPDHLLLRLKTWKSVVTETFEACAATVQKYVRKGDVTGEKELIHLAGSIFILNAVAPWTTGT